MTTTCAAQDPVRNGLSPQRAFVVQFYDTPRDGQAPCSGRVEHMTSGAVAHFQSWAELAAFVARTTK